MPTYFLKPGYLAIVVGLVILAGCKPIQKNNSAADTIHALAVEKLGDKFESYPSPTGSYLLFIQIINPAAANPITKFIVFDTTSQKVMLEKSFHPGYTKWAGDSILEVLDAPAILKQNESLSSYVRKIDISSYKK